MMSVVVVMMLVVVVVMMTAANKLDYSCMLGTVLKGGSLSILTKVL